MDPQSSNASSNDARRATEPLRRNAKPDGGVSASVAPDVLIEAILDSATDHAVFTLDRERRVTSWNAGATRVLGWEPDEIIGRSGDLIFTPEDREHGAPQAEQDTALTHGRAEDERWHRRKDGTHFRSSGVLTPLGDGSQGFLKILRDITPQHQTQMALRESEARFRTLATNIPQLVFRSLGTGDRTWGSPQWENYAGLSDFDSRGLGWLEAIHPDDREATLQAWGEALVSGEYHVEHRVRRGLDGEYRWHQTRALPLRAEDGETVEWVGSSTDVHEMRRLHDRQGVLLKELQHRTRNLLAVVAAAAQQTLAASSSLHEFGQEFTGRLQALGRVQSLLTRSETRPITLEEVVRGELAAHGAEAGGRVSIAGPPVQLLSNAVQTLSLAIHELATNALKYGALATPSGHLTVNWEKLDTDAEARLRLQWKESGVSMPDGPPARKGFGRRLIERGLPFDLGAQTRLEFQGDGVFCSIDLPVSNDGAGQG
jgi:PAS domain S-box-containing protein